MVSTRGAKVKFSEGEKVLCYEPDPTKAKVLYLSKVKSVIIHKSKKNVQYLIHFRGWNPSWDRYVKEEFILKDTPENRQLQKDLAEKSKLQFGAYLYRKDKDVKKRKSVTDENGIISLRTDDIADKDSFMHHSSSSDEDSLMEEEPVSLELPKVLKLYLEKDWDMITNNGKLHRLPAEPTVIKIIESYWRYYCHQQLGVFHERSLNRNKNCYKEKAKPDDLTRNLEICQEMLDGIRIYFDFNLHELLLYNDEIGQIDTCQAISQFQTQPEKVKEEIEDKEFAHLPSMDDDQCSFGDEKIDDSLGHDKCGEVVGRRKSLRSYRSVDSSYQNGSNTMNEDTASIGIANCQTKQTYSHDTLKIPHWKIIPDYIFLQRPLPPSLLYGATHLTRLFVKLPELLTYSNLPDEKVKTLLRFLESFIKYIADNKEWLSENAYIGS